MAPERVPLYAVSDLHLLTGAGQTYTAGGLVFEPYPVRLFARWEREIEDEAWVLIPGDISDSTVDGAMGADYGLLDWLPGRKLLSPGNHDGGPWREQREIERFCERYPSLRPLTWGAVRMAVAEDAPGLVVAACCGAHIPGDRYFGSELSVLGPRDPRRRYRRELDRLQEALALAGRLRRSGDALVVQTHYSPFLRWSELSEFTRLIERAGAELCLYGHYHSESRAFEGERNLVTYRLVAAPWLDDRLLRLGELTEAGVSWEELGYE